MYYCSFGSRGNNHRLGVNNFTKLCKECPNLIDSKNLNQQERAHLQKVARKRPAAARRATYHAEFLVALGRVAEAVENNKLLGAPLTGAQLSS